MGSAVLKGIQYPTVWLGLRQNCGNVKKYYDLDLRFSFWSQKIFWLYLRICQHERKPGDFY